MYLRHFHLHRKPFQLSHDLSFCFGDAHSIPLNELCYSIELRNGLATLVGEPGTGKTTILRRLLRDFTSHLTGVYLDVSILERRLLYAVAEELRIPVHGDVDFHEVCEALLQFLRHELEEGRWLVLLIDEAQALTDEQFSEVRYLADLEHEGQYVVHIILAGQPSLERRLSAPANRALQQRVAVACTVEPLEASQTYRYIEHRIAISGGDGARLFTEDAKATVHHGSSGVPRRINLLCERALSLGYAEGIPTINARCVRDAIEDLVSSGRLRDEEAAGAGPENVLTSLEDKLQYMNEKVDTIARGLAKLGIMEPNLAQTPRAKKWIEELPRHDAQEFKEPRVKKMR